MKNLVIVCSLCFLLLLSYSQAFCAGLWLYEQATPDMGSASAGRAALAADASTVGINPAGMTRLEGSELFAGFQMLYVDAKFDTEVAQFGGDDGGNAGGWLPAGSIGYAHKISPDLSLGIALASYFGLGLDYGTEWAGRYYIQEGDFITVGVNPGLGYRLNDRWSVGAGVSVIYAELDQKVAVNNNVPIDRGRPDGQLHLEEDDIGYGFNLGILYELSDRTRFGLTYRSEVEFEFEDTATKSGILPPLSILASRVTDDEVNLDMNLPQGFMFSTYHKLTDTFALLGNIGWQEHSSFGETAITLVSEDARELVQDRNFEDAWHFALGFQYDIDPSWQLSMGLAYDESVVSSRYRTPDLPLDRQWRYGVGIQHDLNEDLTLGCAYVFLDAGDAKIDQNRGPLAGEIVGDYSTNQIHFMSVNLIKRF